MRENARIKVGNDVLTFKRVAVGGAQEFGSKTFPYALYKADKDASYLIFDLKLDVAPGEILEAQGGTMTVIRPGVPPFVAEVKGALGCNIPNAAPAPSAPAAPPPKRSEAPAPQTEKMGGTPAMFQKYNVPGNRIPRGMIAVAEQKMSCNAEVMRRGATAIPSARKARCGKSPAIPLPIRGTVFSRSSTRRTRPRTSSS